MHVSSIEPYVSSIVKYHQHYHEIYLLEAKKSKNLQINPGFINLLTFISYIFLFFYFLELEIWRRECLMTSNDLKFGNFSNQNYRYEPTLPINEIFVSSDESGNEDVDDNPPLSQVKDNTNKILSKNSIQLPDKLSKRPWPPEFLKNVAQQNKIVEG